MTYAMTPDGTHIAYQLQGQGAPLVLLAGQANNHHGWDDELGIDRADVYGTSMGGRVAQRIAARHPHRVDALVLGCTSPGGPHSIERSNDVRQALTQPQPGAARQALLELMHAPQWLASHPGPHHTLGDPRMPAHARLHLVPNGRHAYFEECRTTPAPSFWTSSPPRTSGRDPPANCHPELLVFRRSYASAGPTWRF
ncbi:alpha/beta fold hydrolase [Micromonospora sp. NPDC003197]